MAWPQVGKVLPRAAGAWCEASKWEGWILAPHGHGLEWAKVLRATLDDVDVIREAIYAAAQVALVSRVRGRGGHGVNCRVDLELTIRDRTATIRAAWHYDGSEDPPRLVSAYPRL